MAAAVEPTKTAPLPGRFASVAWLGNSQQDRPVNYLIEVPAAFEDEVARLLTRIARRFTHRRRPQPVRIRTSASGQGRPSSPDRWCGRSALSSGKAEPTQTLTLGAANRRD